MSARGGYRDGSPSGSAAQPDAFVRAEVLIPEAGSSGKEGVPWRFAWRLRFTPMR